MMRGFLLLEDGTAFRGESVAAETMTGLNGRTVHALPLDRLKAVMRRYRPAVIAPAG